MDLEFSEIYSKLSSSIGDSEKASLKKAQIKWIKRRSKRIEEGILPADKPEDVFKKKESNLKNEYETRIAAIKAKLEKLPVNDAVANADKTSASQNQEKPDTKESIISEKPPDKRIADTAELHPDIPPSVKTEAEKAQRVKAILEKYPMIFDAQYSKGSPKSCKDFFEALKGG